MGYGDIDDSLSFRAEWIQRVGRGELAGAVVFAQDILGNFYCFVSDERVVFFSRSTAGHAVLSPNFRSFIEALEHRDFQILDWVDAIETLPYNCDA